MPLINLLPWRDTVYRQRRRRFTRVLSVVFALTLLVAGLWFVQVSGAAATAQADIHELQMTLSALEQESVRLLESMDKLQARSRDAQAPLVRRRAQQRWLGLLQEWQGLSTGARLSHVLYREQELTVTGISDYALPLQALLQASPAWEIRDLQLLSAAQYQFEVSREF